MSSVTADFEERARKNETSRFRVSIPTTTTTSKFRTNEDREADKQWEELHNKRPKSTTGLSRNEKRKLLNQRDQYPRMVIQGELPVGNNNTQGGFPHVSRTPVFPETASSPIQHKPKSAPTGSPSQATPSTHPSPRPPGSSPSPTRSLPIRLEPQVLQKLAGTLRQDESGAVLGMDFPPRLPAARMELLTLNTILDDLMDSIRSAMTKYETITAPLIDMHTRGADLLRKDLQHAASEVDEADSLRLAFDAILSDLIRQSVLKTRRVQKYYSQHVLRVQEDCRLQIATMVETLRRVEQEHTALRVQYKALEFQRNVDSVSQLRVRKDELDAAGSDSGGQGASIADVVNVCLQVDSSKSRYAALAKQIAVQLSQEREQSNEIIEGLTAIIKEQDKLIKRH